MGRIYKIPFDAVTVTAATQDIWQIATASSKRAVLHGFSLTSSYTTDERAQLTLLRRSTASTGGSSMTAAAADQEEYRIEEAEDVKKVLDDIEKEKP